MGQGRVGQGRGGWDGAGQGGTGQGRVGWDEAGQGRTGWGEAGQGGQGRMGWGTAGPGGARAGQDERARKLKSSGRRRGERNIRPTLDECGGSRNRVES